MSTPTAPERGPGRPIPATILLIAGLLALFVWRTGELGPPEVVPPEDLVVPVPVVSRNQSPREGYLAPLFEGRTLDGDPVRLRALRGHPVFMNFWAPWCTPCRAEMAAIGRLAEESPGDVRVLAIAVDSQESDVRRFVEKYGIGFPVLHDESGALRARFEIAGLPTTLILDPRGLVAKRIVGARAWDHGDFIAWMDKLARAEGG